MHTKCRTSQIAPHHTSRSVLSSLRGADTSIYPLTMNNNGLLERMGGIAGSDMVYHVAFNCVITGCDYSAPFTGGHIVPDETVLFPF